MKTITIEKTLYTFSELSDKAKERAREYFRSNVFSDSYDYEYVYVYSADVADIIGIDLRQTRLTQGDTPFYLPTIYFSGFCSQGDGACFEGVYRYAKGATKKIREHAPLDKELHRIADALQAVQRHNFYRLTASTKHTGRYYHSGCMSVDVQDSENPYKDLGEAENDITQLLRGFADWIYSRLNDEYDYLTSDDCIESSIEANNYEFTEEGEIA